MATEYGAVGTTLYTSTRCVESIKVLAEGKPIRHVIDCITTAESAATCFAATARTGGRYACLEGIPTAWRTRSSIRVKEVMGFEGLGTEVNLGDSAYSRPANQELLKVTIRWTREIQKLVNAGLIKPHPVREVSGEWQGIIHGLEELAAGQVRGQKLVVRVSS
jgi:NADPH:quinone reductase-like Zn-dependent oxidoreductase